MKNLSQMNGDRLIRWTIVPAIKDLRSSRLKMLLQHGFFCIFFFCYFSLSLLIPKSEKMPFFNMKETFLPLLNRSFSVMGTC